MTDRHSGRERKENDSHSYTIVHTFVQIGIPSTFLVYL